MSKSGGRRSAGELITSRQNSLARRAREARDGKDRDSIFIEGLRLCEEAARVPLEIEVALFTTAFGENVRGSSLVDALGETGARLFTVSEGVMDSISDTKSPQGIALVARRPRTDLGAFEKTYERRSGATALVVVLHRAGNASNAGAMMRVAEAAGATAVIATRHTADIFSPKALRGSMGSTFRLPLWTGVSLEDALGWCDGRGIKTVGTSPAAALSHTEFDWTAPCAVVVGPEGEGLGPEEVGAAGASVKIPMRATVESLNVAAALAVVLYEAARQRGFSGM